MTESPFIKLLLRDAAGWTEKHLCSETAIAAVTGQSADHVKQLFNRIILEGGNSPDPTGATDPQVWRRALDLLGYTCILQRDLAANPVAVEDFIASNNSPDLLIVYGVKDGIGHIFACQGRQFVDCHTSGRIVSHPEVAPLEGMQVHRLFRVGVHV